MSPRLVVFVTAIVIASTFVFCGPALTAQVWTDGDADGLPDAGPYSVAPNTEVTVGLWIDAEAFSWTNYLAYVEWAPGCIQYVGATYVITGGSNFPIDSFSHPNGVGFGGIGFNEGGIDHIGNINLTVVSPIACCVSPIINPKASYYVFSQLGAVTSYTLFSAMTATCYGEPGPLPGACCLPDGSCTIVTEEGCVAAGGAYLGNGTQCASANCVQACCYPQGDCLDLDPALCISYGATPQGPGTTCATDGCPAWQACCFPWGPCRDDIDGATCTSRGGVPQGPGTTCENVT
jgi:hypothetical protein